MDNKKLEIDNIFEVVTKDEAERLKNISDKLIQQRELLYLNEIEFKIIKSPQSSIAGAEVGVEARHTALNIIVQSTSYCSQYQNKLAAIELIKKEIAHKLWNNRFDK